MKMCHYRCESKNIIFRCTHTGKDLQGDHWYPYARGGATSIKNLVMLCPKCNRSKSDKIPSHLQTFALRMRRRYHKEYETNIPLEVGEWLPLRYKRLER